MSTKTELRALGLMSGTSLDGMDIALIETDGERIGWLGPTGFEPYDAERHGQLRALLDRAAVEGRSLIDTDEARAIERAFTLAHARAIKAFMADNGLSPAEIDVIGFHGQTILHRPQEHWTWQIGDGALLAHETGIPVVNDFRSADVAAGGEGAPFAPLYHRALLQSADLSPEDWPVAVVNIGGVGNVTWFGADGAVLAFDTGPGNALIDDWIRQHTEQTYDTDGALAMAGMVNDDRVRAALENPYFERPAPKSLDRLDFSGALAEGLTVEDGAATLASFTVASIAASRRHMPALPKAWYICGGGRKNRYLINGLKKILGVMVEPVETLGWRGDSLEAEAFGFLAVRSLKGLPLSLPQTTGVPEPMTGGVLSRPAA